MTRSRPGRPRGAEIALLIAILTGGALLRVAYFADLRADPLYVSPALDAQLHDYWAWGIASGDWTPPAGKPDPRIATTPYFRPPGYPCMLSAVYRAAGRDPAAPRVLQFALGLATAALGWWLGRRLAGRTAGLAAAAILASCWSLVYFEGQLLDPAILSLLTLLSVLATLRAGENPTPARGLLAGLAFGAFALIRPNILLVAPAAVLWLVWVTRRRGNSGRGRVAAAALLAGLALAILPVTVRNRVAGGEWVLLSTNGGINLYVGNNDAADAQSAAIPEIEELTGSGGWTLFDWPDIVAALGRKLGHPVGQAEASRYWGRQATAWIATHPARFAALTARRAALFWGPAEVSEHDARLTRAASGVLRRIPIGFPFALALAITGAAALVAGRREIGGVPPTSDTDLETAALLGAFAAAYFLSYLAFFFNARFRAPLVPILALLAGIAVDRIARLAVDRRAAPALAWGAAALLLWGALSVDVAAKPPREDEWRYQRGNAWRAAGRLDDAEAEYRAAIRLDPDHDRAHNDLGVVQLDRGRLAEAAKEFEEALRLDPRHVGALLNLGGIRAQQGAAGEAVRLFRNAVELRPGLGRAHVALGSALLMAGDRAGAMAAYRRAVEVAPSEPLAHLVLGRELLAEGKAAEAIGPLEEATRLRPSDSSARRLLDQARATAGRSAGTGR